MQKIYYLKLYVESQTTSCSIVINISVCHMGGLGLIPDNDVCFDFFCYILSIFLYFILG